MPRPIPTAVREAIWNRDQNGQSAVQIAHELQLCERTVRHLVGRLRAEGRKALRAGYVGAAATKSVIIGLVILATARFFVAYEVQHPFMMLLWLVLTALSFCLFGFILGVLADGFEKLQIVPMLILTPLTFLGGTFYSIDMLPELWQSITLLNPVVYLISGFRWSFYGVADVDIGVSLFAISAFLALCLTIVWWIFKTGYRLKN